MFIIFFVSDKKDSRYWDLSTFIRSHKNRSRHSSVYDYRKHILFLERKNTESNIKSQSFGTWLILVYNTILLRLRTKKKSTICKILFEIRESNKNLMYVPRKVHQRIFLQKFFSENFSRKILQKFSSEIKRDILLLVHRPE